MFEYIANCTTSDEAISKLNELYIHPSNEIFARRKLTTRNQNPGESIDGLLQRLRNFALVLAQNNSEEYVKNVPPVYSAATGGIEDKKDLLLQLLLVEIFIFVKIIGILETTVHLVKPIVTNVKRKIILQKFFSQKGVQSHLLCIKQTIMLFNDHFFLVLQLEYLVVYKTL